MEKQLRRKDLFSKEFNKFSIKEAAAIDGINHLKRISLSEEELISERDNLAKQFNCSVEKVTYSDIYWRLLNKKSLKYFSTDTERYAWNQVAMADFVFLEGKIKNSIEILMLSYKILLKKENIYSPYIDFDSEISIEMNQLEFWQNVFLDIIIEGLRRINEETENNFVLNEIKNKYPEFYLDIKTKFKEFNKNIKENKLKITENEHNIDDKTKDIIDYDNSENKEVGVSLK